MEKKYSKYEIWQPFLLASMVAVGMVVGQKINNGNASMIEPVSVAHSASGPIGRVEEIVRFIETKYVDSLDSDAILENAISDIIDDLDPHSIYLSPDQLGTITEQMEGSYRGIGVESFYLEDTVRISKVIPGSPAAKAGIIPLDKLIAIGDSVVAGMNIEYSRIRNMLRANSESELKIKVLHENSKEYETLIIAPSEIDLNSTSVFFEIAEDVGYIKIERFSSKTYKEFMEAFESLVEKEKIKHLIIDVRDNPGGYLPETVNILSQLFNEKGKLLVYTAGKDGKKTEYKTSGKNFFPIDRIAVLMDEGSASGSEIIAGAIQDWDRGIIIGRRSFGKGLVQEQYRLKNGGAIRLTTARYYTPTGRSIQKPYEENNNYDDDIHKRYVNGEMFEKSKFILNDTTAYKTMILNRNMYGGGGIFPDVFIPLDSTFSYYDLSQVSSYIPEYIFRIREKHDSIAASPQENVEMFLRYLENQGLIIKNKKLRNDLLDKRIRAEWAYQEYSLIEKEKVLLTGDEFIDKALEYIVSDKDLRSFQ